MGETVHDRKSAAGPRILVVDPFPLLRDALDGLLSASGVAGFVEHAGDLETALAKCAARRVDIVVTDVDLTGRHDGIRLCRQIKRVPQPPRVLVLSSVTTPEIVADCVSSGADSFVHRSANPDVVVVAITTMIEARQPIWFVGGGATGRRQEGETLTAVSAMANLTSREREVLSLVLLRFSNDEIAARLHLAKQTVKNYVSSTLQKLGFASRAELFASPFGAQYHDVVHRLVPAGVC